MDAELKKEIVALIKQIVAGEEIKEDAAEDKKEGPASMEELKAKRDEVLDSKEE